MEGLAAGFLEDLSLRQLETLGELRLPDMVCPECEVDLVPERGRVTYQPDERELARLVCDTDLSGDHGPTSRWSLLEGGALRPIHVTDEAGLVRAWGRPLSVREHLRLTLAQATEKPDTMLAVPVGPGQVAYAMAFTRPPDLGDPADVARMEAKLAESLPRAEQLTGMRPALLLATTYAGAGDVDDWAGPFAEPLRRGQLMLFTLVDLDTADRRLEEEARRQGAIPDRFDLAELPEGLHEHRRELPERTWFTVDGHRLSVDAGDVPWFAAGRALTIAEAAGVAIADRVPVARRLGRLAARLAADADCPSVAAPSFDTVLVGDVGPAGRALVVNLERIASRNPDDDEAALAEARRMVGRLRADQRICDCEGAWFISQLRHAEDPILEDLALIRTGEIQDLRGDVFVLVATRECAHEISYLTAPQLERLVGPEGLEAKIAEDRARVRMTMAARLVQGADGRAVGAILNGDRIATCLADADLRAALMGALSSSSPLRPPLIALAPTTDVILAFTPSPDAMSMMETALLRERRRWDGVPGSPLGFVGELDERGPVRSRIALRWPERPSRSERRAGGRRS